MNQMSQTQQADILKSAALIIRGKKVLYVREHDEPFLAPPGGSVKPGEDPLDCLKRELQEELGVTKYSLGNDAQPFYTTPLAPAATQPDKMLQMSFYTVELLEEPRVTYNPAHPVEGEDIEALYWIGGDDLVLVSHEGGRTSVRYRENAEGVRLTHMNEDYVFPKLIELGVIDTPVTRA